MIAGISGLVLSADGKKALVSRRNDLAVIDTKPEQKFEDKIDRSGLQVVVDPRAEWKQEFRDAWRIMRDYFYDENMHNVDWEGMYDHYAAMLDDCFSRDDVTFLIQELISELNVGHAYYRTPPSERTESVGVGLLGADFEFKNGAYRIAKIYGGAPWDVDARGPLSQPGIAIKEGDYLLAINGVELDEDTNPLQAAQGLAGSTAVITVSDKPKRSDDAKDHVVKLVGSEAGLRFRNWIEAKRAYVDKQTDGKVGYIYVPNTGVDGQNELFRQFYGQKRKAALIIDERWNGGGQIPTRFIELLNRPVTNYWAVRDGKDWTWPPDSHQGPQCMLINGLAGSGGDMFPWLFRHNKLGKIIGTRTWGGLVGISGNPRLIDGTAINVPTFGFYETDGTWGVEGHGVDPDIEVIDDPAKMVDGGDPQLDAAIKLMLKEIKENGYQRPDRPKSPDRKGMDLPKEDW
ncbi:MAG: PDZ domain-containing protein [Phycisphaerae bacterium]